MFVHVYTKLKFDILLLQCTTHLFKHSSQVAPINSDVLPWPLNDVEGLLFNQVVAMNTVYCNQINFELQKSNLS